MKTWRVAVIALSFLLLSGCLVTFKDPLPAHEAAPDELLGHWTSKNAWGEPLDLQISGAGEHRYKAVSYPKATPAQRDEYLFTVSRHGSRWYLSAPLPAKFGGHYFLAGFDFEGGATISTNWWSITSTSTRFTRPSGNRCCTAAPWKPSKAPAYWSTAP
ncbi:hypothetical protein SAMN04490186_6151 [Pseudomonas grimontii]|uniref:Lipoprotein n=1 Tax=Pseudomonas grimontii TaxID=129847 RepID=A0ABY0TVD4_9PSED|nr:hypothetical protein SAMN04490186_6151 [Pseudomonas grimontii]